MLTLAEVKQASPDAKVVILELDLTSFASVKAAAETFLSLESRLDILLLNAGVAFWPPKTTVEGYEVHFGTNHMGHALLARLLMKTMVRSAAEPGSDVRIVSVASHGHTFAPKEGIAFPMLKTDMTDFGPALCYGQSKLAVILYMQALAKRYPTIKCVSLHTGPVYTPIMRGAAQSRPWIAAVATPLMRMLFNSVQTGAKNQLWCCVADQVEQNGYYDPVGKQGGRSELSKDERLVEELWAWTEKELCANGGDAA